MIPSLRKISTLFLLPLALQLSLMAPATAGQYRPTSLEPPASAVPESLPLTVRSEGRGDLLQAEVTAALDLPFETVAAVLADPSAWCDFVPLTFNVKSCIRRQDPGGTILSLYAGRKYYQPPEAATRMDYRFRIRNPSPGRLMVSLVSAEGPLGIHDSRIELEVVRDGGGTRLRLISSYRSSLRSRLATRGYLATLGRAKIGFTVNGLGPKGPEFVQGVRGMIERNAMRYYLALQAYLATRHLPGEERFEARLRSWFGSTEGYPLQLHEMEEQEYLAAKRRERRNQVRLQQSLGKGG